MDRSGLAADPLEGISCALWEERHRAEHLLYRLCTARLLLLADHRQHAATALDEVADAAAELRAADDRRRAAVDRLATRRGPGQAELTLGWLAGQAPAEWRVVFVEHHRGLCRLVREIEEVAGEDRMLAARRLRDLQRAGGPGEAALQRLCYRTGLHHLRQTLPPALAPFLQGRAAHTPSALRTD